MQLHDFLKEYCIDIAADLAATNPLATPNPNVSGEWGRYLLNRFIETNCLKDPVRRKDPDLPSLQSIGIYNG